MKNYLTTGEFAKLLHVSKDTLYHYDRLGIFSPEYKLDNQYRFYSIYQVDSFQVIQLLKELDMPLKEIKVYLDKRTPQNFIQLLEKEEDKLTKKINSLNKMKGLLHNRIHITKEALYVDTDEIKVVCQAKDITLAYTDASAKNMIIALANHYNFIDQQDIYDPHGIGGIIDYTSYVQSKQYQYLYFYSQVDSSFPLSTKIKTKGNYLTCFHVKGYDTITTSFDRIQNYANSNGLQLDEYLYEELLLDEMSLTSEVNYLIKLSIKIKEL